MLKSIHEHTHTHTQEATEAPEIPTAAPLSKSAIWSIFTLKAAHNFTSPIG